MTEDSKGIQGRTCCICLTVNSPDGLLIDTESPWLNVYMFCFGVAMSLDGIPRQLCGSCRNKLMEYSDFKKMALRSDKLWNSVIHMDTSIIKLEKSDESHNDLEEIKCFDDDDYLSDNYVTHVESQDTQDITLLENAIFKKQNSITHEVMCYSCGSIFDSDKKFADHLLTCTKINDLETSKEEVNDSDEKFADHLLTCTKINDLETSKEVNDKEPNSYKLKLRDTSKRKVTNHRKKSVGRNHSKKESGFCDSYNELGSCEKKIKALNKHLKKLDTATKITKKPEPTTYDCGLCEETFSNVAELQQHLTDHSNKNELCCMICDFIGRDFADMVTHRMTHLMKGCKHEIKCHLCNKMFIAHMRLQFHYRSEHLKEKGGWCSKCNKRFDKPKSWIRHELFHVKTPFICDLCDQGFLYRHEIIDHLGQYHYNTYKFVCELCGRGFQRKSNLQCHTLSRHNDQKVKCTHCNKIYKNTLSLEAHMKEVTSEKPHQCEICSKRYRTPSDLKKHMVWHLDDRKYACKICGVAYKANQSLKNHMYKHSGYKKHKCDQCTSSFTTTSQLKVHYSVHTGVRRHKCSHCMRNFNEKKRLLKHIAKCHSSLQSAPKDASVHTTT